jgi:hypothetical protein
MHILEHLPNEHGHGLGLGSWKVQRQQNVHIKVDKKEKAEKS